MSEGPTVLGVEVPDSATSRKTFSPTTAFEPATSYPLAWREFPVQLQQVRITRERRSAAGFPPTVVAVPPAAGFLSGMLTEMNL